MADSPKTRKTMLVVGLITLLVLIVLGGVISVRGCHQPNDMEERIDPDDQLPGTQDATGSRYTPDAEPLLHAA